MKGWVLECVCGVALRGPLKTKRERRLANAFRDFRYQLVDTSGTKSVLMWVLIRVWGWNLTGLENHRVDSLEEVGGHQKKCRERVATDG